MQKLLPLPLKESGLQQLNPQFQGIARNLGKKQMVRRQAEHEKMQVSNRIHYLKKEQDSAEKKVLKKQRELQILMNVIARKQADEQRKESLRQAREEAQARQRELNMKHRSMHEQRVRNVFLQLYDQHHENVSLMRNTFKKQEQMRRSYHRDIQHSKKKQVLKRSLQRQEGRYKITNFHKERIDLYTSRYKQKIRQEEEVALKLTEQAKVYSNQERLLKSKLENSSSRIQSLQEQIKKASSEYRSLSVNRSLNWSAFSNHYQESQTKEENTKDLEPDQKLERELEREMNLN